MVKSATGFYVEFIEVWQISIIVFFLPIRLAAQVQRKKQVNFD